MTRRRKIRYTVRTRVYNDFGFLGIDEQEVIARNVGHEKRLADENIAGQFYTRTESVEVAS